MFEGECATGFALTNMILSWKKLLGNTEIVCASMSVYIPSDALMNLYTLITMLVTQLAVELRDQESLELHHLLRLAGFRHNHQISRHNISHRLNFLLDLEIQKLPRYRFSLAARSAWWGLYRNCGGASSDQ
jgi:hypothetical protein